MKFILAGFSTLASPEEEEDVDTMKGLAASWCWLLTTKLASPSLSMWTSTCPHHLSFLIKVENEQKECERTALLSFTFPALMSSCLKASVEMKMVQSSMFITCTRCILCYQKLWEEDPLQEGLQLQKGEATSFTSSSSKKLCVDGRNIPPPYFTSSLLLLMMVVKLCAWVRVMVFLI